MADFSEMLNGILSNPQAMQQMMALAQSLGLQRQGGQPQQTAPTPPPPPPQLPQQPSQPDPMQLLQGFLQMSKQMGGDERQLALFQALKPFVRPDRAEKLDRAIQVAKISRLAGNALGTDGRPACHQICSRGAVGCRLPRYGARQSDQRSFCSLGRT